VYLNRLKYRAKTILKERELKKTLLLDSKQQRALTISLAREFSTLTNNPAYPNIKQMMTDLRDGLDQQLKEDRIEPVKSEALRVQINLLSLLLEWPHEYLRAGKEMEEDKDE